MDETTENMLEEDLHAKTLLNKMQDFFSNKQVYNFFLLQISLLELEFSFDWKKLLSNLKKISYWN